MSDKRRSTEPVPRLGVTALHLAEDRDDTPPFPISSLADNYCRRCRRRNRSQSRARRCPWNRSDVTSNGSLSGQCRKPSLPLDLLRFYAHEAKFNVERCRAKARIVTGLSSREFYGAVTLAPRHYGGYRQRLWERGEDKRSPEESGVTIRVHGVGDVRPF